MLMILLVAENLRWLGMVCLLWLKNREGCGQMPGHDGVSAVGKMTEVTGARGGVQMARIAP